MRNTFSSQVKLIFWTDLLLNVISHRPRSAAAIFKDLDRLAPDLALTVVDLSKIKNLPLDHLATSDPAVFDQIPIAVLLAIFLSRRAAQKHDGMPLFTEIFF
ncbi:MAG TPA: hypothetical protein VK775_16830 [Chthoniobacterales bacterium]|jgi:hypothetical protein|nr:hypothetical protein [Chthoniobacterales bacterium]